MALGTSIVNKSSKKLAPKKPAPRNRPAAESTSQPQAATPAVVAAVPEGEPRNQEPSQAPVVHEPIVNEADVDDINNDRPTKRRRLTPTPSAPPAAEVTKTSEPQVHEADANLNAVSQSGQPSDDIVSSVTTSTSNEARRSSPAVIERGNQAPLPTPEAIQVNDSASARTNAAFLPTPEATQEEVNRQVDNGANPVSPGNTAAISSVSNRDDVAIQQNQATAQDTVNGGLLTPAQTQREAPLNEVIVNDLERVRSGEQRQPDPEPANTLERARSSEQASLFLPSDDTRLEDAETLLALRRAHSNGFADLQNGAVDHETQNTEEQDELPDSEVHVVASTSKAKATPKPRQPRQPKKPGEPKKPRQPRKKAAAGATGAAEGEATQAAPQKKPRKKRQPKSQATVQATEDAATNLEGATRQSANVFDTTEQPEPDTNTAVDDVDEEGNPLPPADEEEDTTTAKRGGGRRRAETPSDAEDQEIDPVAVSMFELTHDLQIGKVSHREKEMRKINWVEVAQRRKQAEEEALARAIAGEANGGADDDEERQRLADDDERRRENAGVSRGPQLRLVNGQMILDTESLVVTNRGNTNNREGGVAEEESDLTKKINSQSWLYDNRREPTERFASTFKSDPWTEEQTDAFYDALRMFGTDFFIISKMFPGKTRRHIKLKFVREERLDPDRVKSALIGEVVPMDMGVYCAATGMTESQFKDPVALEEELRVESEQQREELEKQRDDAADAAKKKQEAAQEKTKRAKKTRKKKAAEDVGGDPEVDLGEVVR